MTPLEIVQLTLTLLAGLHKMVTEAMAGDAGAVERLRRVEEVLSERSPTADAWRDAEARAASKPKAGESP